jgi:N-terminal half of MaoC dehydratase
MVDPSIVGKEIGRISFPIERSKLAELSKAFGEDDPVWHDARAARALGFDSVPTPPTVTVLMDHWREGGVAALVQAVGMDLGRVLHGEAAWEYLAPVRSGDELSARQVVTDVTTREGKRGGAMTLLRFETEFTNQRGEVAVRRTDTLIEREA